METYRASDGNADIDALMDNLFASFENVAKNVGKVVPSLVRNIGGMITSLSQYAGEKIKDGWDNIVYPFIQKCFRMAFGVDLPDWETLKKDISDGWTNTVWPGIQDFFSQEFGITLPDWETLKNEVTTKIQELSAGIEPALNKIAELFSSVSTKISEFGTWISGTSESATNFKAALWGVSAALAVFGLAMGIKSLIDGVTTAINAAKAAFALFNTTLWANPILLVIAGIAGLVAALTYLYNKNENVRAAIDTAWNGLKTTFETVSAAITATIQSVVDAWNKMLELLGFGNETGTHDTGNGIFGGFTGKNTIPENPNASEGSGNLTTLIDVYLSDDSEGELQSEIDSYDLEGEALVGADPSSGNKIQSFLDSLNLTATVKLQVDDSELSKYDGSHAGGLDRVPFNGYRALLHKDEMVLTAAEAAVYRRQKGEYDSTASRMRKTSANNDQPINVTLNINGNTSNPYELAGEVRNALELLRWQG